MAKTYLPKSLVEAGQDAVFSPHDIIYMKFIKDGKIVRVARADPVEGIVMALYPTDNPNLLEGESFCHVDDNVSRIPIQKSKIGDRIWISLIEGSDMKKVLEGYPVDMLGFYPSGSYKYGKGKPYQSYIRRK